MTLARMTRSAAVLFITGVLVTLAAPASAQTQSAAGDMGSGSGAPGLGLNLGGGKDVDAATLEKRREIENAYKNATRSVPAQTTAVNDPWANMRGPDEQKPAAKPAPKTAQKKKPAQ